MTTRVLVLGATGMLGHVMLRVLAEDPAIDPTGTVRSPSAAQLLPEHLRSRILSGIDVENNDNLVAAFATVRPAVVINCVGLVKQLSNAEDPLAALPVNSIFPQRLMRLCDIAGARLVQISTDCVFAGTRGMYRESDPSDCTDVYGKSKFLGEVDAPHAITLRTSMIGHELSGSHGLLEWFLSREGTVRGFRKAIFSGLPTVELARVIRDHVMPRREMRGVYHVASEPISKYDLIRLFAQEYGRPVTIVPDDSLVIDRSLDGSQFRTITGYTAAPWPELVRRMREFG